MNSKDYISSDWEDVLKANQLDTFEELWPVAEDTWFEPPNHARGGWSGVTRQLLTLPNGGSAGIFIKRQEDHTYRSWRRFFQAAPTLEREYYNCQRFRELGIPSLEPIYFAERSANGKIRAILITRELEGYRSLESSDYCPINQLSRSERNLLIECIAGIIRKMHAHHFQHTCLYPKHVFVKRNPDASLEARFIDLEKTRCLPFKRWIILRDMDSLRRHAESWSRTDCLRLFLSYQQEKKLSQTSKRLLFTILGKRKK